MSDQRDDRPPNRTFDMAQSAAREGRTFVDGSYHKTCIDELHLAVFKFLIERDLPLMSCVEQPGILIEMKGRMLSVLLVERAPGSTVGEWTYKQLPGSTRYMIEEDSRMRT